MKDVHELLIMTRDELGLDAYVIYPDSRRSIPDTVLWAFASACLLEYLKPLIDFKGLGEKTRRTIEELLRRWRTKDKFEEFAAKPELAAAVTDALSAATPADNGTGREKAVADLAQALTALGVRAADAVEHAERIAELVSAHEKK